MKRNSTTSKLIMGGVLLVIAAAPLFAESEYLIHIGTLILLWAFVSTAWAYMARFGLVSLGHGVFLGIGAYIPVLLFNYYGISPWLGMLAGVIAAVIIAAILGYACFRFGLIGDYFALVTLAMAEVVSLAIVACREITGGSLGCTLKASEGWADLQFDDKRYFYYIIFAFLLLALYIWRRIDKSRMRLALTAIEESELAAASMGVSVIRFKMGITLLSAGLTAMGGVLYAQYVTYINPGTISGVGVSLSTCFKAILGGMFNIFGPLAGSAIMVSLEEYFRVSFDTGFLGVSEVIFGIVLLVMIIFLPRGIVGSISKWLNKRFDAARS
ncbi:MAG: branched-chain amino acid ABC transporter permease [Proteobacteria bacterium]|nr:branched-chain amino acid ABC transporter permease [Pseudomonadota bacterium]MBU1449647.1 branched-chain amino acid ABC transporter permease [Pseudomonadota bacterium]MBU2469938.1 branched-chain amino acid ABC transporter permease [Pseudomonadota bacterium]MBU2516936.1 branched-chain amino acid ABC transporter permease [Pseudomonadota bacterium]